MSPESSATAQRLTHKNLMESFESLEDPRRRASCAHALQELLLTALCAVASGADDWVDVAIWGQEKLDWLRQFLPFDNGVASHDTFSRVFGLIDGQQFEACFAAWMRLLCPSLQGHAVHIDGKSVRGSHDGDQPMTHLVSAWDSAWGVTLGQIRTASKSNEITAIPQLLQALDVRGATVTIDAMGCQREIVQTQGDCMSVGPGFVLRGRSRLRSQVQQAPSPGERPTMRSTAAWSPPASGR